jgi:uncharacterized integral membrane protein (TIGR00698 family)
MTRHTQRISTLTPHLPGIAMAVAIGSAAWAGSWALRTADSFTIGASVLALAVAMAISLGRGRAIATPAVLVRLVLPVAIVLLGFSLDLSIVARREVGVAGIAAALAALITSFAISVTVGRALGLNGRVALALGAGGGVCGNSAVIAVSPSLRLEPHQTALLLATVNLLGVLTFALVPVFATLLGMAPEHAGMWAGASVHAIPQAVAAGEAVGGDGLLYATAVKLTRVSFLIIVVPLAAYVGARTAANGRDCPPIKGVRKRSLVPWFVPGFIAATVAGTFLLPSASAESVGSAGQLLMLPVLAAIGLSIRRESLLGTGRRLMITGLAATAGLMTTSLLVIKLLAA